MPEYCLWSRFPDICPRSRRAPEIVDQETNKTLGQTQMLQKRPAVRERERKKNKYFLTHSEYIIKQYIIQTIRILPRPGFKPRH